MDKKLWHYDFPIGTLTIACDDLGITDVTLDHVLGREEKTELTDEAARQLDEYFRGKRRMFDLPLSFHGTPFQQKVWNALLEIPYGETRSYADIAARIGSPKAARAVGGANGSNSIIIIVPCHRVIAANSALGGYSGGLDVKRKLLTLEGAFFRDTATNSALLH